jgi:DNA polymerase IV
VHNLVTVTDLAQASRDDLAAWFRPTTGPHLRVLARGGASTTVTAQPWVAKSRSRQVTFQQISQSR